MNDLRFDRTVMIPIPVTSISISVYCCSRCTCLSIPNLKNATYRGCDTALKRQNPRGIRERGEPCGVYPCPVTLKHRRNASTEPCLTHPSIITTGRAASSLTHELDSALVSITRPSPARCDFETIYILVEPCPVSNNPPEILLSHLAIKCREISR